MKKTSGNIKNSTWNLANILLYPIAFLALTPFFINKLGENHFGIWMLVNSYVYIAVNIISFGLGNSITAYVAEAIGKGSHTKLQAYVNSSTKLIGWISMSTILIAILWSLLNLSGTEIFNDHLDKILIVATCVISVKFWELLYQSVLKGYERYDLASWWSIVSKLLVLGVQVVIVLWGYNLYELFLSNLILNAIMVYVQAVVTYKLIPQYQFSWQIKRDERKELFHFGFWTWLQTIISVLAYQVDRFIIAIFLGPAIAGYYILASTITNHMHMAFGAIVSWLFPKVARKKELGENIVIYFQTLRGFSVGISLLAIFVAYLFYEPLFTLWLGPEKFQKMGGFFRLFLVYESFLLMTIVPLFYLNGMKWLKFITSLEFMYKVGIILGMVVAFWIIPTGKSLIIGQIIALALLIPVEYLLINKFLLKDHWLTETLITMLPSFLIAAIIFINNMYVTIGLALITIFVYYFYYLNPKRFKIKLLLE
ncbi:MAG: oligosaccharide flippase family protein [Bacteroidales bacterium]|nr:oligosaccharide flippase family protein [Bacteroidales bacterium]